MQCQGRWAGCLTAVGLVAFAGCGSSDSGLVPVSGNATFAGKPIVYGLIEFVPDKAQDHSGPATTAEIVDGKFSTSGGGIVPGPHLVRITAMEERPAPTSEDETIPTNAKPPIFSGYTIEATLVTGEKDFDVPESAKGFDIFKSSAPKRSANEP
jgi:hypothetical protein